MRMPDDIKLTAMQKAFVEHYVSMGCKRTVVKKAAIAAGYSPNCASVQGSENLKKPNVVAAIEKMTAPAKKKAQKKYEITLDRLIHESMDLLETCKTKLTDEFDAAAVNAGRGCLEFVAKVTGLTSDRIQLDANINNRHSVDMVRILETDSTSKDAFALLMDRKRSALPVGESND